MVLCVSRDHPRVAADHELLCTDQGPLHHPSYTPVSPCQHCTDTHHWPQWSCNPPEYPEHVHQLPGSTTQCLHQSDPPANHWRSLHEIHIQWCHWMSSTVDLLAHRCLQVLEMKQMNIDFTSAGKRIGFHTYFAGNRYFFIHTKCTVFLPEESLKEDSGKSLVVRVRTGSSSPAWVRVHHMRIRDHVLTPQSPVPAAGEGDLWPDVLSAQLWSGREAWSVLIESISHALVVDEGLRLGLQGTASKHSEHVTLQASARNIMSPEAWREGMKVSLVDRIVDRMDSASLIE